MRGDGPVTSSALRRLVQPCRVLLAAARLEQPLRPPRRPWEVGLVAFEIARRHRFAHDLTSLPTEVELHVMPTGGSAAPAYRSCSKTT